MALSNGIRSGFKGMESVLIITPTRHGDHRGFFGETYSLKRYAELGVDVEFVQDNHSLSALPGTMLGLHFQAPPHAQAKLEEVIISEVKTSVGTLTWYIKFVRF